MTTADRVMKVVKARTVEFVGYDMHGDYVSVTIKGDEAQQIIDFLQTAIKNRIGPYPLPRSTS